MDEPVSRVEELPDGSTAQPATADSSPATVSNETASKEVEYSPISGWLLVAIGFVICGLSAWILANNNRSDSTGTHRDVRLAIDVNRATIEELQILPRIGPALAGRIVQYVREHGPVTRLEQLDEIHGLGPRIIEELAPYLIFPTAKLDAEAVAIRDPSELIVGQQE